MTNTKTDDFEHATFKIGDIEFFKLVIVDELRSSNSIADKKVHDLCKAHVFPNTSTTHVGPNDPTMLGANLAHDGNPLF